MGPLILDRALARRLRHTVAMAGRESSHDADGSIAAWVVWSGSNGTPIRHRIYLSAKGL
ncbi:hypothetical protein ACFRIC_07005 [Streptomyces sp. NPDC056738]|uniref:hypothetical protein n=1 Tax=Streptomyces sp. NPDC056738 TaxID=3345933 RepID=UPI00368F2CA9